MKKTRFKQCIGLALAFWGLFAVLRFLSMSEMIAFTSAKPEN